MGRMARGWQLTKQSWAVVKADRSLLGFPVLASIAGILAGAVLFGAGGALVASTDSIWPGVPFFVVGAYALIVIGQFCAVALASCATRALDGEETTVGEGLAAARSRFGVILRWSAVQLVVGAAISALQALLREGAGALVSTIVGGLANFAWGVATFFVVPIIALEGLGPKEALKRSVHVIRERWGEGVVGAAAVGGIVVLAGILPGILMIVLGVMATGSTVAGGVALIAVGAVVLIVATLVQTTLLSVFKVALYRFATSDEVVGGYERAELQGAFRPKGRATALAGRA